MIFLIIQENLKLEAKDKIGIPQMSLKFPLLLRIVFEFDMVIILSITMRFMFHNVCKGNFGCHFYLCEYKGKHILLLNQESSKLGN